MQDIEVFEPVSVVRRQAEVRRIREPVEIIPEERYRLSWVAYLRPLGGFLIRGMLALLAQFYAVWLAEALVAVCLAWLALDILSVRRTSLIVNDKGVWIERGLLPWTKGARGIKWRDIGDAGFFNGFLPWALSSYRVVVTHRFTTDADLVLPQLHRGNRAVEHINSLISSGACSALRDKD